MAAAKWVTDEGVGRAFVLIQKQRLQVDLNAGTESVFPKPTRPAYQLRCKNEIFTLRHPSETISWNVLTCTLEKRFAALAGMSAVSVPSDG